MPFTSYSELQDAAVDFMKRAGQLGKAPDWITLAESRLNRLLGPVEENTSLTATIGDRNLDISLVALVEPLALFISEDSGDEAELQKLEAADMPYAESSGLPSAWCMDNTGQIQFDRPPGEAYRLRLRSKNRFALSELIPINWLLENHPDVYLAATLMWGAGYNEAWQNGSIWKTTLEEGISEVQQQIAKLNKASSLRPDPMLARVGRSR